jgi:DNA-3-methyladenine glycosylase
MPPRDKHEEGTASAFEALAHEPLTPERALSAAWYEHPVVVVARELLGCLLISTHADQTVAGMIVETEAYDGEDDPASHSAFRRNGVVKAMWGPRGTAYVYRAYGMYPCFNVVAGPGRRPAAVLVRALQPIVNLEEMARRTGRDPNARVAGGPGLTGRALALDLADNGHPLRSEPIWIQPGAHEFEIVAGPRIGITRGTEAEWRFGIAGHPSLSRRFP